MTERSKRVLSNEPPKSILIVGAGVFGLSTAYSLLNNPRYAQTHITILDQWAPDGDSLASTVTPASIDNSRIIRPDYASKPYSRLASLAQHQWRQGWPRSLPAGSVSRTSFPDFAEVATLRNEGPYRESGLLLTRSTEGEGLNPRAQYYVDSSLENILEMAKYDESLQGKVEILSGPEDFARALGIESRFAERGYLNKASGWADAGVVMAMLKERLKDLIGIRNVGNGARAIFLEGSSATVKALTFGASSFGATPSITGVETGPSVTGAKLISGETLQADLTILAAGAWSSQLLPATLRSRIKATGQALGYIVISRGEAARLAHIPVPLDLSHGLFIFPPIPMTDGSDRFIIKIARHGWGYTYPVTVPNTEPHDANSPSEVTLTLPAPDSGNKIGGEATKVLLDFVNRLGVSDATALHATRTCWYADTATGDWIIDYVPKYGHSLLVATGGSGHGFKFAPVLGDWIVKAIEGSLDKEPGYGAEEGLGAMLKRSWRWRSDQEDREAWLDEGDGSRGGKKGMLWLEEIAKGADCGIGVPAA